MQSFINLGRKIIFLKFCEVTNFVRSQFSEVKGQGAK